MNVEHALKFIENRGVEVQKLNETNYEVFGFYKSGSIIVDLDKNEIVARYNERTKFESSMDLLGELIQLNHVWYERSKDRWQGWSEMDANWVKIEEDYEDLLNCYSQLLLSLTTNV